MVRHAIGTVANSSVPISMFSMMMASGAPHLTMAAAPGTQFRIDYSDMVGANMAWQTLTNFTSTSPVTQIAFTPQPRAPAGFYRAVTGP